MKRRLALVVGLVVASGLVAQAVRADVAATVSSGGSVEVFLTINVAGTPSFAASPTGGLGVTFSPPTLQSTDQWSSIMTIDAAATAPGDYGFPMTVTSGDGGTLTVQIQVTVQPAAAATTTTSATTTSIAPPTTAPPPTSEPPQVTSPVTSGPAPSTTSTTSPAEPTSTTMASAIGSGSPPSAGTPAGVVPLLPLMGAAMVLAGGGLMLYSRLRWPHYRHFGS